MTAGPGLGPAIPRRRFGAELRRLRTEQGKRLQQVAKDLMISTSKLSRLEKGQGVPRDRDVRDLLDYYGLTDTDLGRRMWAWAEEARETPWWTDASDAMPTPVERYMQYETAAAKIRGYSPHAVPSLLQVPAYTRALLISLYSQDPDELDRMVNLIQLRQMALDRDLYPLHLDVVIDEAAFHRTVGTDEVMREQLLDLAASADRDNIAVRILSFQSGPHPVMLEGVFTYFHFRREIDADVVNIEGKVTDQYIDQPEAVNEYRELLDGLAEHALSPERSRDLILRMAERY